jgi:hypothetical protein
MITPKANGCCMNLHSEMDFYNRGLGKISYPKDLVQGMVESCYRTAGKLYVTMPPTFTHSCVTHPFHVLM